MMVLAYENEATVRLKVPLLNDLAKSGKISFPADGHIRMIEDGKPNNRLTLGQLFHFMVNEREVRRLLELRDLDVDRIVKTGSPVIRLRNTITHGDFKTHHAEEVRGMLLGKNGNAFSALCERKS